MIKINIHEAKARLSHYLGLVAAGEAIVICRHNRPVAELRPVEATRAEPRPFGLAGGAFEVGPVFFEPLPVEELEAFDPTGGPDAGTAARVAEESGECHALPGEGHSPERRRGGR